MNYALAGTLTETSIAHKQQSSKASSGSEKAASDSWVSLGKKKMIRSIIPMLQPTTLLINMVTDTQPGEWRAIIFWT
jgi:hypothetical protein